MDSTYCKGTTSTSDAGAGTGFPIRGSGRVRIEESRSGRYLTARGQEDEIRMKSGSRMMDENGYGAGPRSEVFLRTPPGTVSHPTPSTRRNPTSQNAA